MSLDLQFILAADADLAYVTTARLLERTLAARVRRVIRSKVPWLCECQGPVLCAPCRELVDDLLLRAMTVTRETAAGDPPVDRKGRPIQEWLDIVDGLTDPAPTASWDADQAGALLRAYVREMSGAAGSAADRRALRERETPEQKFLRVLWAQAVYYPTAKLGIDLLQKDAVRRGMPAKPMRDLDASPAAARLAEDPSADAALRELITGLHANVGDPFHLPRTLPPLNGDVAAARAALERGRAILRDAAPELYERMVAGPVARRGSGTFPARPAGSRRATAVGAAESGEDAPMTARCSRPDACADALGPRLGEDAPDTFQARRAIDTELVAAGGQISPLAQVLRTLVDTAYGKAVNVVARCRSLLGLDDARAEAEVARLTLLAASAGLTWLDERLVEK